MIINKFENHRFLVNVIIKKYMYCREYILTQTWSDNKDFW